MCLVIRILCTLCRREIVDRLICERMTARPMLRSVQLALRTQDTVSSYPDDPQSNAILVHKDPAPLIAGRTWLLQIVSALTLREI
jgi:hypothetical protein